MKIPIHVMIFCAIVVQCQTQNTVEPTTFTDFFINSGRAVEQYVQDTKSTFRQYLSSAKSSLNTNVGKVGCQSEPDSELNTLQLIAKFGYPAESHAVLTEDGYILSLHRIPKKGAQPVILHHGLLGSSADWVLPGPVNGLAFILSDAGYDVWLGNARGNTYSKAHVNMSSNEPAFWNFTFHEIGYYDLPAYINHINSEKGSKGEILYIGHSMGTTMLFSLLSTRPEYNNLLKAAFLLAPVSYLSSVHSPIRFLAPFTDDIRFIAELLGANEFLPQNIFLKWLARNICEVNKYEEKICENVMFLICGYDEKQFNQTLLPIILSHTPAGASTKTLVHFGQEIKARGAFQMFDYGTTGNQIKYGQDKPPPYPLHNITLPIAFFVADNDWLASVPDARKAYNTLPNPIEFYEVPMKDFNHLDFIWGMDAKTLVFNKLMTLMEKYKTVM